MHEVDRELRAKDITVTLSWINWPKTLREVSFLFLHFLSWIFFLLVFTFLYTSICLGFCRDRQAPLFHSRVGLTSCIGAGHIVFFVGIDAIENKVRVGAECVTSLSFSVVCLDKFVWAVSFSDDCSLISTSANWWWFLIGCLCYNCGSHAVLPDGSFLLDACWGSLHLLICGKGVQRQR